MNATSWKTNYRGKLSNLQRRKLFKSLSYPISSEQNIDAKIKITLDGKLVSCCGSYRLLAIFTGLISSPLLSDTFAADYNVTVSIDSTTDAGIANYPLHVLTSGSSGALLDIGGQLFTQTMLQHATNIATEIANKIQSNRELILSRISTKTQLTKSSSNSQPQNKVFDRLVLMPLRVSEEDKNLQGSMETALAEGLQHSYIVFSGPKVAQKAHEAFVSESRNTTHMECDEARCMQKIAGAFQTELIATANVTKQDGSYFLALSIQNVFDNKVVYSKSFPCEGCRSSQIIEKLKELSNESN